MNKTFVFIGLVVASSLVSFLFTDKKAEAFSDLYSECRGLYNAPGNPWGENGIVQEVGITPAAGQTEYIRSTGGNVSLRLAINVGFCADHSIREPAVWRGCGVAPTACYQTPSGKWYGTYYPRTIERYFVLNGGMRYAGGGAITPIALNVPSLAQGPYNVAASSNKPQGSRTQNQGAYVGATINVPSYFDTSRALEFCIKPGYADSVNYYNTNQQLSYSFFQDNDYMCTPIPITSYNYNLVPLIDLNVSGVVEVDSSLTATASLRNDGPSKTKAGTEWQFVKMVVGPGANPPVAGTSAASTSPCAYYGNGCGPISTGSNTFNGGATTTLSSKTESTGDIAAGSRICYATSVRPYNHTTSDWRHSTPACVTIGKKPKVQVWGSDLSVGRRFAGDGSPVTGSRVETSKSIKDSGTKTFGSWVEYGIFASGTITGASAAGLAGQNGNSSSSQSSWDKLTFANAGHTGASGCTGTIKFGCYTVPAGTGTIPDVAARLAPTATTGSPLTGTVSLGGRNGTFYANGNLTISGGTIDKNKSVIIRASGTVTISGDIRYTTESLNSISEIPQVVIIANDIRINDNVTNVDAWLIANGSNGRIYTCGSNNFTQILTSNTCKEKLTINGPVMAKKLYLTRTSGSGTAAASGEPAEVLNLRADAYLWAIGRSGGQGSVQTINTRELAPRF
jgi:adhesin HecA-like repeat protein